MTTTTDYLNEFNDEIAPSQSIAYAQIQNPPNLSLAQIKQYNAPWGLFIATDQKETYSVVSSHFCSGIKKSSLIVNTYLSSIYKLKGGSVN